MKKAIFIFTTVCMSLVGFGQTAKDLFKPSEVPIMWLGVDFSHVKLIGSLDQLTNTVPLSVIEIRDVYFPRWNSLFLSEQDKYDVGAMLRKSNVDYNLDMVTDINLKTAVETMEDIKSPRYTQEQIAGFVKQYNTGNDKGIGVILIAETLNKNALEAYFHFVAFNMTTKDIIVYDRLRGVPMGIGFRNYWAGAVYDVMKQIRVDKYSEWKKEYLSK